MVVERKTAMASPIRAFTPEQIRDALIKAKGYQYRAANLLQCHHKTVERYVTRYPELKEIADQFKGERTDAVEGVLVAKALAGEPWAVIFYLKTQGRARGYTEKFEFSHEFKNMSNEELLSFIQGTIGAYGPGAEGSATPGTPADETIH